MVDEFSVKTVASLMTSIGGIFSCIHHTKLSSSWPTSPLSYVVIYSQLYTFPSEIAPFKDYLSTHKHLTNLRNKPQERELRYVRTFQY